MQRLRSSGRGFLLFFSAVLLFVVGQVWATLRFQDRIAIVFEDLRRLDRGRIADEKARQEALKLRIENEQKNVFLQTLIVTLSGSIGLAAALSGAWIGFSNYLSTRERERLDRAASDMEHIWEGIAQSSDPQKQAASIAGLLHFLHPDNHEFHTRVAAALALAGRMERKLPVVMQTLAPVLERAMREAPEAMRQVSWQGLSLVGLNVSGTDLAGFDFRDSHLPGANFQRCILRNARFDNARLVRSAFDHADLSGASLEYADLADASLAHAQLAGASLRHVKLLNLDLRQADLRGAQFSMLDTDFRLVRNWRTAHFPTESAKARLLERIGPPTEGPRILMLMWEFLPKASGGAWTAAHHLLRNLRKVGTDLTVMVPWPASAVSFLEFGNEIRLLPLGDGNTRTGETYTTYADDGSFSRPLQYSSYRSGHGLFDAVSEFAAAAGSMAEQARLEFDVIHAHDWLAFPAAMAVAEQCDAPFVAHIHSIEEDRQPERPSFFIQQVERQGCQRAVRIVVPSRFTRDRLIRAYGISEAKILVVPNSLSEGALVDGPPLSNFGQKKVVFSGRMTAQKGPDRFVEIAHHLKERGHSDVQFVAYGSGPLESAFRQSAEGRVRVSIPKPQQVPPSAKGSEERIAARIEIAQVVPIDYDESRQEILRCYAAPDSNRRKQLEELILTKGFTAYAVWETNASHVIRVDGLGDGVRYFAVQARGLLDASREEDPPVVTFEGGLQWRNRLQAFDGASVLVVPSRSEPFGMIVLEAMQCGIPVVYDREAGCGEVLHSGIPVDSANLEDTAGRIVALLEDPGRWQEISESQLTEIREYLRRGYEQELRTLWSELANVRQPAVTAAPHS